MRASEWRVLALRLGMWDMIGFWHKCICDGASVVRSCSTVALLDLSHTCTVLYVRLFIVFHGFLLYEYNVKKYCVQSFFNVLS